MVSETLSTETSPLVEVGGIGEEELIAALQAAVAEDPEQGGFVTAPELARALRWSKERTRDGLRTLIDEGLAEMRWVKRRDLSGRMGKRPAYRLIPAAET